MARLQSELQGHCAPCRNSPFLGTKISGSAELKVIRTGSITFERSLLSENIEKNYVHFYSLFLRSVISYFRRKAPYHVHRHLV